MPQSAGLQGDGQQTNLAVLYKVKVPEAQGGGYAFGVIPRSEIVINNGKLEIQITLFGAYQAVVTRTPIEVKVEAKTAAPIATARQEAARPGAFAVLAPRGPVRVSAPIAQWAPAAGVDHYDVAVASDAGCTQRVGSVTTTATESPLGALADGRYVLCVQALNADGIGRPADEFAIPFQVDTKAPEIKISTSPVASSPLRVQLRASVGDASETRVKWRKVRGPGTVVFVDDAAAQTDATVSAFGEYELALTATDAAGNSGSRSVVFAPAASSFAWTFDGSVGFATQGPVVNDGGVLRLGSGDQKLAGARLQAANGGTMLDAAGRLTIDLSKDVDRELPDFGMPGWTNMSAALLLAHFRETIGGAAPGVTNSAYGAAPGGTKMPADAGVATTPGFLGNALVLDGSDDFVTFGPQASLALQPTTMFTMMAWVKPLSSGGTQTLMARGDDANGYRFQLMSGYLWAEICAGGTCSYDRASQMLAPNQWHHVAAVFNGNPAVPQFQLYIDGHREMSSQHGGESISTTIVSPTYTTAPFTVGARVPNDTATELFMGQLDEVAVIGRPLGELEIDAIERRQATPKLAEYFSPPIDGGSTSAVWSSIAWTPQAPYGRPLPDNGGRETSYPTGNFDMAQSTLLVHFDEPGTGTPASTAGTPFPVSFTDGTKLPGESEGAIRRGRRLENDTDRLMFVEDRPEVQFDGSTPFTVAVWIRWNGGTTSTFLQKIDAATLKGYKIESTTGGYVKASVNGTNGFMSSEPSSASLADGRWHALMMVYGIDDTNVTLRLYVDGVQQGAPTVQAGDSVGSLANPGRLYIGSNGSMPMGGAVDELAAWRRALTTTDAQLYADRGLMRVWLQRRVCSDPTCGSVPFTGPNNTEDSAFEDIGPSAPPVQQMPAISGRFIQLRVMLSSLRADRAPQIASITPGPTHAGMAGVVTATNWFNCRQLVSFTEVGASNAKYQLSVDGGATFLRYGGTRWVAAGSDYNTAAQVNAGASALPSGKLTVRVLLSPAADGGVSALDDVKVSCLP
jgi:hypothetical protein